MRNKAEERPQQLGGKRQKNESKGERKQRGSDHCGDVCLPPPPPVFSV